MEISINKILIAAISILVIMVAFVLFISIRQTQRVHNTTVLVSRTEQVLTHIQNLMVSVLDNETSSRGYVITGKEQFLEQLKQSETNITNQLALLKTLITNNPDQQALFDSLTVYSNKRITFSNRTAVLRLDRGLEPASALVSTNEGKFSTDKIRYLGNQMREAENALLEKGKNTNENSISQMQTILYSVLAAGFILSLTLFQWIRSESRKQKLNEQKFSALLDAAPDAIVIVNETGTIKMVNLQMENLFGYKRNELIGQSVEILIPREQHGRHAYHQKGFIKEAWITSMDTGIELKAVKKNGVSFPVEIISSPIKTSEGLLVSASVRDMTEKRKTEDILGILNKEFAFQNIEKEDRAAELIIANKELAFHEEKEDQATELILANKELVFQNEEKGKRAAELLIANSRLSFQNEESLKEISDYKYALDESSILAITDQKGIIKHVNDNFCRISKYSVDELIGKDHRIINSGHHSKAFIRNLWTAIANGKIWRGELKNKAKDGTIYWVDTVIVPFLNEEGKPFQYVAIRADITERKAVEENLKKSLKEIEDYKYALDESSIVAITDQKGIIKYVNDNFCEISKYSAKELLGKDHRIINSGYHAKEFIKDLWVTIANGKIWKGELKNKAKDGTVYWVDTVIVPFLNEEGKPYQYVAIREDITERKAVEENLKKSLKEIEDYKYALDESSIVAITDQKGIIKYVNDNFCKISKYSAKELLGKDHRIINSGYHAKEFIKDLWVTIANGKIWKGELKNKAKDGTVYWVDTVIVPFLNEEGKPYQYVAIRADITERKKVQLEIHELNEELEQKVFDRTAQLESVNKELESFSYSVSHDLRAPLRIIDGFGQILKEDYAEKLDEEGQQTINTMMSSARKMGQLIDDFLNFSKIGRSEIRLSIVNMNELVEEVLRELKNSGMSMPVQLKLNKLINAKGDNNLLKQVWVNLISNAIKYSGAKKDPVIEIGMVEKKDEQIYYVKDNGAGFDMQYADKLFGVFQRFHKEAEFAGTGVGLALVQRIIVRHGGSVWAEAKINEGATFYFVLPEQNKNYLEILKN